MVTAAMVAPEVPVVAKTPEEQEVTVVQPALPGMEAMVVPAVWGEPMAMEVAAEQAVPGACF